MCFKDKQTVPFSDTERPSGMSQIMTEIKLQRGLESQSEYRRKRK